MRRCKEYRKIAWDILMQNLGSIFLFALLAKILISSISSTGFGFLILGPFFVGVALYYLRAVRREPLDYGALFEPILKNDFLRTIALYLLKLLLLFLWGFLFIIPALIKNYSYSMAIYIALDNPGMKAKDCITLSRKMMDGYKFKLFLLNLSFIGWYILGSLLFFIGSIFVSAYHNLAIAAFYDDLKKQYNTQTF
ncbi:MAG TPA: DUF975 family protein [Clostridia bacterium]